MRSAIRKLIEILVCAAELYKEITLSALRIVPGRDWLGSPRPAAAGPGPRG